jgi:aspartyl protease family protein
MRSISRPLSQPQNGVTMVAPMTLSYIDIEGLRIEAVEAFVAQPGALSTSLLGMSFLHRLTKYQFEANELALYLDDEANALR